jgi:hypothetical protein
MITLLSSSLSILSSATSETIGLLSNALSVASATLFSIDYTSSPIPISSIAYRPVWTSVTYTPEIITDPTVQLYLHASDRNGKNLLLSRFAISVVPEGE